MHQIPVEELFELRHMASKDLGRRYVMKVNIAMSDIQGFSTSIGLGAPGSLPGPSLPEIHWGGTGQASDP